MELLFAKEGAKIRRLIKYGNCLCSMQYKIVSMNEVFL